MVLPARASLLQFGAAEPALRPTGSRAGLRSRRQAAHFGAAERAIYEKAVARAWEHYRELTRVLEPTAHEILADIWHVSSMSHPKRVQKVERQSEKRAIEVARYVLPVAAFTTMVHTISGIVLHRL